MSDIQASAEHSSTAEEIINVTASETPNLQGVDLTGLDEVKNVDDYRRLLSQLPAETAAPAVQPPAEEIPGTEAAEEVTGDEETETTEEVDETDEAETQEQENTAPDAKKPQYRLRPKDDVEGLAMDIMKRTGKAGNQISMADALAQAANILTPKVNDSGTAEVTATAETETAETLSAKLTDLKAERKQAFGKDLNFEKAAELDEEIETTKERIADLRKTEETAKQTEAARWETTVQDSQKKAVEYYPDSAKQNSAFVAKMQEIDALLLETEDDRYYSPDKPFMLAKLAAKELGTPPKSKATPAASSKPVTSTRPVQPAVAPISGSVRTTQATPHGQLAGALDKVQTPEQYQALIEQMRGR